MAIVQHRQLVQTGLVAQACAWHTRAMISVIIPTYNAEKSLAATLTSLITACVDGLVREVVIVDCGSDDQTLAIADQSGATVISAERGRGSQLRAGAAKSRCPWMLFLHADTVLDTGWEREAAQFMERIDTGALPPKAAHFRFRLDDLGAAPRVIETGVALRTTLFRLPYGDQGMLIPRALYQEAGGYSDLPIMEDLEFVRRLGRSRIFGLRSYAVTSAARYRQVGYIRQTLRNQRCLGLFMLRVPPQKIVEVYGAKARVSAQ